MHQLRIQIQDERIGVDERIGIDDAYITKGRVHLIRLRKTMDWSIQRSIFRASSGLFFTQVQKSSPVYCRGELNETETERNYTKSNDTQIQVVRSKMKDFVRANCPLKPGDR